MEERTVAHAAVGVDDWDEHWGRYTGANAANPAQAYRRELIFDLLGEPDRLLELGSGSGEFAKEALRRWPNVNFLGLDKSRFAVERARHEVRNAQFAERDFSVPLTDPKPRGWATHVVCSEVLEHFENPAAVLKHVSSLFEPGCKIVVTVPAGPMSAFDKHIGHRQHFTRRSLARTLHAAGLHRVVICQAGFPFFNVYRLAVLLAGESLTTSPTLLTRLGTHLFSVLFRFNEMDTPFGWQLVAVAEKP